MKKNIIHIASAFAVLVAGFALAWSVTTYVNKNEYVDPGLASIIDAQRLQLNIGWTRLSPQGGQNIIYVSSSQGNDANDGLSPLTPVKTLGKGQSLMRMNHGDWMVLKRGDVWDESFGTWTRSGTGVDNPTVISSYGTGERPIVNVRNGEGGLTLRNAGVDNFAMIGIHIRSFQEKNKKQEKGITLPGNYKNITLDDMFIEGFTGNVVTETCETCTRKNLTITHSIIANAYNPEGNASGIFITSTDGIIIEDSIFYHNGWNKGNVSYDSAARKTAATQFNQGLYLSHNNTANTIVRNNIIADTANGGVWLRRGGLAENNFFVHNTNALLVAIGPNTIRNNVMVEGVNNIDGGKVGGIESKPTNTGTVFENNLIANSINNTGSAIKVVGSFDFGYGEDAAKAMITRFSFTFKNNIAYNAGVGLNVGTRSVADGNFINNNFYEGRTQASVPVGYAPIGMCSDLGGGGNNLTITGNTFSCEKSKNKYVVTNSVKSFPEFTALTGNSTNKEVAIKYADPDRSINNYVSGGYEAFVKGLLNQSLDNWNPKFTASALNDYFRAGFKVVDVPEQPVTSLNLISPNGNETVTADETVDIKWKSSQLAADSTVKIDLYKGGTYVSTLASTAQNTGTFSWKVSVQNVGADFKVRITSNAVNTVADTSDQNFEIKKPTVTFNPGITITSPNGGEALTMGTKVDVKWDSKDMSSVAPVRISLYKAGVMVSTLIPNYANSGVYSWTIGDRAEGSDYSIKVTALSNEKITDESNATFTLKKPAPLVPVITVNTPNGGETITVGDNVEVKWSAVNFGANGNVRISLYKAGVQVSVLSDTTLNDGSYTWTIGDRETASDFKIRVTSLLNTAVYDESNATFTINKPLPPAITVTSPNGGEAYSIDDTVQIRWSTQSIPASEKVRISLYKAGVLTTTLATDALNTGSYSWTIGSRPTGSDYTIRVTRLNNETFRDDSNAAFTINPQPNPSIVVLSPNGGESLKAGTTVPITWKAYRVPTVRVSLYKAGVYIKALAASVTGSSYNWVVGGENTGPDFTVRVTSVDDAQLRDASDGNFTIVK